MKTAQCQTAAGDLLVLVSTGLSALQFPGKPVPAEKAVQHLAREAQGQPLAAAFARIVSEWKRAGVAPGDRDVLLLAARRQ